MTLEAKQRKYLQEKAFPMLVCVAKFSLKSKKKATKIDAV
jgi:hypothetical protein